MDLLTLTEGDGRRSLTHIGRNVQITAFSVLQHRADWLEFQLFMWLAALPLAIRTGGSSASLSTRTTRAKGCLRSAVGREPSARERPMKHVDLLGFNS